ncbi:MAG: carbonate dehydratase [Candidatus Omnitrophica bacterium]|nr:carbonate dehydratase [Candidatus Omnitrophota bacterium]
MIKKGCGIIRKNPDGDIPKVDKSSYVDPTALIVGRVKIGKNVFIGPYAVMRADEPGSTIVIGNDCNIQDRVVIHALTNSVVSVEHGSSLSHGCIVHGPCRIGAGAFIGFGAVVFRSILAERVFVGHLSLTLGVDVPERHLIPNRGKVDSAADVKALERVSVKEAEFVAGVVLMNKNLVKRYKRSSKR